MKFSLSSYVLIAHWVPGFLVVMAARPLLIDQKSPFLKGVLGVDGLDKTIAILVVIVGSFFAGEVLDSARDLLENVWDLLQPVDWEFFFTGDKEKLARLVEHYYTFYAFQCNVSLALAILFLLARRQSASDLILVFLVLCIVVFVLDAIVLRRYIAKLTTSA